MISNINYKNVQKIAIVGNSCTGKSTLAYSLGEYLQLPVFHIDKIQFTKNSKLMSPEQLRKTIAHWTEQKRWIIDGIDYNNDYDLRFNRADTIIMTDLPLWKSYLFIIKRMGNFKKNCQPGVSENYSVLKNFDVVFKGMWERHKYLRPLLIKMIHEREDEKLILHLKSIGEINRLVLDVELYSKKNNVN